MVPKWCHHGAMNLSGYVETLRQQLAVAAAAGGDDARALAERLTAPLDSATRLVLLDALSAAAGVITRDMEPGSVDLRLGGRGPRLVGPSPPPPTPSRPTRRQPPPRPRPRTTGTRPWSGSTCGCPSTSRAGWRKPPVRPACRSTPGWSGRPPPLSTTRAARRTREAAVPAQPATTGAPRAPASATPAGSANQQPEASNQQPEASNQQPEASNQQPEAS